MSDTPRTDAARPPYTELQEFVSAEFARTLERHLNAANELIVRLQAVTNDPHALWANWLRGTVTLPVGIGDVREYQGRIKRLEEALSWRWRPIETAPHNHTWVLGYDEKDGEIGMIIFERGDESEPQWTDVVRTWSPTHWMPLPDEPKAKEAKP